MTKFTIKKTTEVYQCFTEPTRVRMVNILLVFGEMTVTEIYTALGKSQNHTSRHLIYLAKRGVVKKRRDGYFNYYSINPSMIYIVKNLMFSDDEQLGQDINSVRESRNL